MSGKTIAGKASLRIGVGLLVLIFVVVMLMPDDDAETPVLPPVSSPDMQPAAKPSAGVPSPTAPATIDPSRPPKIPPVILQADAHDSVTKGMLGAMRTVVGNAPGFVHRYFSETSAREYIHQHEGLKAARLFDTVGAVPVKLAYFALVFLAAEGGVFVAPYSTAIGPLSNLVNVYEDTLVWVRDSDGTVDGSLLAAAKGHPLIRQAARLTVAGFRDQNPEYGKKPFLGLTHAIKAAGASVNGPSSAGFLTALTSAPSDRAGMGRVHIKESWVAMPFDHIAMNLIPGYRARNRELRRYHGPRALSEVVAGNSPAYFRQFTAGVLDFPCPFGMRPSQMLQATASSVPYCLVDMRPVHPRRRQPDTPSRIPRVMFQTSKAMRVPVLLRQAMQSIIDLNPSMEHRYFTDEMQEEYVRLRATPTVLKAYLALVPHAFRSDLFRYVYLYNEGGCYFDSDFVAAAAFEQVLDEEVEFVSAEDNGIGFLYNALMCSAPKHPLMRLALNMSVTRIISHFYDHSALSITGPGLFGDAFDQLYGQRPREFRRPARGVLLMSYRRADECGCGHISDAAGRHYFATAYPEFRTEMKSYHRQRPYWAYVEQRAVYADGDKTLPEESAAPDDDALKA